MYKQRIGTPLKKGLDQGKRSFMLYGNGIQDCFLEDFCVGVLSLQESMKRFFLNREDCDHFVVANTDGVQVFAKQNGRITDISQSYLMLQDKEDSEMPNDDEEGKGETSQGRNQDHTNQVQQMEQTLSSTSTMNYLGIVKSKSQDRSISEKKTAVFFEDFEWLSKLYSSNNSDSLEYIKMLKDFNKIDECYTIASLEDIELLQKYNFETKGSNVIFIGNPSTEEVKLAYTLKFLAKTDFQDSPIQLDLFEELKNISQAMSSSKKSLREALQVLDAVVLDRNAKNIKSVDFEIAVEKITTEKVSMADIIIEEEEKQKVIGAVEAFLNHSDSRDYRKGFILTGPPGTGKTQLVKALANDYHCYFMAPKLSDLKGEYVGQTSGKVKRIFDEARANEPTIMFIDEADTVFPSRDFGMGASDSFNLDMVNQFLQEIEGMTSGKEKIFVIAATNRPNIIDAAVQSRLTERIPIGLPGADNRIRIFNKKLERYHFTLDGKPYTSEIQSKTVNMSGRDIENFVKKLKEYMTSKSPYGMKKIEDLGSDEKSRKVLLEVLETNEQTLIEDLQKSVPVEVLEPNGISMGIKDIIGYDEIKERILRQASYIRKSESEKSKALNFGIKVSKGILLYGPPGNGKTMLAQAIAKDQNFYFVKVLSKDFMSDSISKQLDNLQMIFDQVVRLSKMCNKHEGVVLFFDEFDSLARFDMNHVIRGTLLDYLASGENTENEGLRSAQSKILLIAATNFKKYLDSAIIRKGRIDDHLLMDNPSEVDGIKMLREKFASDDAIKTPDVTDIEEWYQELKKHKQDQSPKKQDEDDETIAEIRPSGSDIINLYNELKAEAYFADNPDDGKILELKKETADNYFDYWHA